MSDKRKPAKLNCPTCEKQITWDAKSPHRPFCSERCRLIDLGAWANEEHKIAGQSLDPYEDLLSEDKSLQSIPKMH